MSTLKVNNLQVGQDSTASNNFTLYQPATPDGTVRLGVGNSGSVTDTLVVKGDRIGIGLSNPQQKLTVRGLNEQILLDLNSTTNGDYSSIAWNGTQGDLTTGKYTAEIRGYRSAAGAHGDLTFHTRDGFGTSNEIVRITAARNVGIGTDNPTTLLDVVRSSTSGLDISMPQLKVRNSSATQGNGSTTFNQSFVQVVSGNGAVSSLFRSSYDSAGSYGTGVDLWVSTNNYLRIGTNNQEKVRIASDGNVGIGTDNPTSKVHVYGLNPRSMVQSSSDASYIAFGQWDTTTNRIESNDRSLFLTTYTGSINLGINGSTNFILDNSGNVGIGTNNPGSKLHVENGSVFVNNGTATVSYHAIKGSGAYLARSFRYDNYKTGWSNGAWVSHYRFTRSLSQANNGIIGVIGGMLHIVYVNDRTNAVQTSGYDSFPIIVRARSNDTMSIGIGAAIADVETVIGSSVQVQVANASATSIDLQIRIYNADGANGENFCHSWIDFGGAASHSDQFPEISLL